MICLSPRLQAFVCCSCNQEDSMAASRLPASSKQNPTVSMHPYHWVFTQPSPGYAWFRGPEGHHSPVEQ